MNKALPSVFGRLIKDQLAWHCFDDLPALEDRSAEIVQSFDHDALCSLVAWPYLLNAHIAA